jgi:transcriptional regulator with XRE-family HTH domain
MPADASPPAKGFQDERYRALIDALVEARRQQRMTQTDLAKALGHHQQFVSRYETGERRLDVVEWIDIARCLGLDPAAAFVSVHAKGVPKRAKS